MTDTTVTLDSFWQAAEKFRDETLSWLPSAKVELDKDPAANIGGLHVKAAEIRSHANRVRDVVFATMGVNMQLKSTASVAEWAYEQAMAAAAKDPVVVESLSKLKTKDEREGALKQICAAQYQDHVQAEARLQEWDQFLKMVNLVYYSLTNTREDLSLQVSIIKQQMFNGEVKPNQELGKLSSLADLLGADARNLLKMPADPGDAHEGPAGMDGDLDWSFKEQDRAP